MEGPESRAGDEGALVPDPQLFGAFEGVRADDSLRMAGLATVGLLVDVSSQIQYLLSFQGVLGRLGRTVEPVWRRCERGFCRVRIDCQRLGSPAVRGGS